MIEFIAGVVVGWLAKPKVTFYPPPSLNRIPYDPYSEFDCASDSGTRQRSYTSMGHIPNRYNE